MKKKQLNATLRQVIDMALRKYEEPTKEEIAKLFEEEYPELTRLYRADMFHQGLLAKISQELKNFEFYQQEGQQLQLFGEDFNVPTIISVLREDKQFGYVNIVDANWKQLQSSKKIKADNINNVVKAFNDYDYFLNKLGPFMENDAKITVQQVIDNQQVTLLNDATI